MRILLTGGSGLLGTNLIKLLKQQDGDGNLFPRIEIDAPSRLELDITQTIIPQDYDLIIHSAAYTDVVKAETEVKECIQTNVIGTLNLAKAYEKTRFVYISSEYAHDPVNYYSLSKYLGELVVNEITEKCLIIRTLFKPTPFPWSKAFTDQYTQGDYVDVIAPLIVEKILNWYGSESELCYIGTGRKTIYDLAKQTKPDVREGSVDDVTSVRLPKDYE
jgi:dTDP-4-dehydrorhamnose reductase